MKKKARSTFQIIGGKINYHNPDFENDFQDMKLDNEGTWGECVYEIVDKAQYFQHKYYRGFVLPDITFAMGEISQDNIHIELKKEFLFRKVDGNYESIPKKHRSRCIIVTQVADIVDEIVGYIPSTANLTYNEMKEFIDKCEHRLFVDLQDTFREQREAMEYRKLSIKGR